MSAKKKPKGGRVTPKKSASGKSPPLAPQILTMQVIPEPEEGTATVLKFTGEGTVLMRGSGNTNYQCGSCHATILESINLGQMVGVVLPCNACGAFNAT